MTRELTCAERISSYLKSTEELYTDTYRQIDNLSDDAADQADDLRASVEPLAVTVRRYLRIELAWGGPAAWLEARVDYGRRGLIEIVGITFHFADWFDHAEQGITEHDAPGLWRLAEHCAGLLPETELVG